VRVSLITCPHSLHAIYALKLTAGAIDQFELMKHNVEIFAV